MGVLENIFEKQNSKNRFLEKGVFEKKCFGELISWKSFLEKDIVGTNSLLKKVFETKMLEKGLYR